MDFAFEEGNYYFKNNNLCYLVKFVKLLFVIFDIGKLLPWKFDIGRLLFGILNIKLLSCKLFICTLLSCKLLFGIFIICKLLFGKFVIAELLFCILEIKDNEEILYITSTNRTSLIFYNLNNNKKIQTLKNLNLYISSLERIIKIK